MVSVLLLSAAIVFQPASSYVTTRCADFYRKRPLIPTIRTLINSRNAVRVASGISDTNISLESTPSTIEDVFEFVQEQHKKEIQRGFETFKQDMGANDDDDDDHRLALQKIWSDDDFDTFSVGVGNGGPTEHHIDNGHCVFRTKKPVLSPSECQSLIDEAKEVIQNAEERSDTIQQQGGRERTNSQLNEAKLSDMSTGKKFIEDLFQTKLFPMLESRFGVKSSDLTLNDALVIGYIGPSKSQPIHRDASILSLQIALSPIDDYVGGGTYFEATPKQVLDDDTGSHCDTTTESSSLPSVIKMERGHVLCHCSGIMHAGRGVEQGGQRWILVLFVLSKSQPQIAKRCHAEGINAMDHQNYKLAELYYHAGLSVAPSDHLLHIGLSNCYFQQYQLEQQEQAQMQQSASAVSMRRHHWLARKELELAKASYEPCHKAHVTHAHILLSMKRPRAALRQFNFALDRIGNKDLLPDAWTPLRAMAWDVRVHAGRCACLCAEQLLSMEEEQQQPSRSQFRREWTKLHLPVAIGRFKLALQAAPGHGPLQEMLNRAEYLLHKASEQQY